MTDRVLWTPKECAARLRVSRSYLRASSCPRFFLPSLKPGGRPIIRYDAAEVEAWLESRRPQNVLRRVS